MRRYVYTIAIVLLSILIVSPSSAQIFGIGAKGGLNFSTLSGDFIIGDEDFELDLPLKNKTGFVIGASYTKGLMPLLSLQTEILYIQKGAKIEERIPMFGSATLEASFDLDYLEIPVLLRVGLPLPGLSPFVYAGPAFAYNLSADLNVSGPAAMFFELDDSDIKDSIKNLDYGLVLGGGMQLGLPLVRLHIEARYTIGLTNIIDDDEVNFEFKNRAFSLMVGFTI